MRNEDALERDSYERARKQVDELRRFYVGLLTYLVVNLGLFFIDLADGRLTWFYWPLAIWGALLLLDGLSLFVRRRPLGDAWQERKIRELMSQRQSSGARGPEPHPR